jgi:hypothetical protein
MFSILIRLHFLFFLFCSDGLGSLACSYTDLINYDRTPWTGDETCLKAVNYTGQHKHSKQISMLLVGFELTIPVFERATVFHASDWAAAVIAIQF